jgi:hypothetical protein
VDRTGKGLCPVVGFGISSIEPTGFITGVFVTCGIQQQKEDQKNRLAN